MMSGCWSHVPLSLVNLGEHSHLPLRDDDDAEQQDAHRHTGARRTNFDQRGGGRASLCHLPGLCARGHERHRHRAWSEEDGPGLDLGRVHDRVRGVVAAAKDDHGQLREGSLPWSTCDGFARAQLSPFACLPRMHRVLGYGCAYHHGRRRRDVNAHHEIDPCRVSARLSRWRVDRDVGRCGLLHPSRVTCGGVSQRHFGGTLPKRRPGTRLISVVSVVPCHMYRSA